MVVISILSLVLVVVGVQVFLILRNINKTLNKANNTMDTAAYFFHNITHPLNDVKAMGQGVKTGLYVAEHVVGWLKSKKQERATDEHKS